MSNRTVSMGTAEQSVNIEVYRAPVKVCVSGLSGSESIAFKDYIDANTAVPIMQGGTAMTLTTSNTSRSIDAPGRYTLTKSSTSSAIKIGLSGDVVVID